MQLFREYILGGESPQFSIKLSPIMLYLLNTNACVNVEK